VLPAWVPVGIHAGSDVLSGPVRAGQVVWPSG
jgi:hypothetical protein